MVISEMKEKKRQLLSLTKHRFFFFFEITIAVEEFTIYKDELKKGLHLNLNLCTKLHNTKEREMHQNDISFISLIKPKNVHTADLYLFKR